jgi:glycosyltransferase involved in cell wall biosynthesis
MVKGIYIGPKMRVSIVLASIGEGGLEKHTIELANSLNDLGVQVTVIADNSMRDYFDKCHFISHNFNRWRFNPFNLLSLLLKIRKGKPEIVHAQASKASLQVGLLTKFLSCKTITSIHGLKRRTGFVRSFDGVIGVSNQIIQPISHPNKVVIYNGVDYPTSSLHKELPSEIKKWVAIGRLVKVKGFETLIEAFQYVDGQLDIIGDGNLHNELRKKIDSLSLSNRVRLIGKVDNAKDEIDKYDAVVISSEREGFSYVFAEALLQQRPVISTDVPIANEVLDKEWIISKLTSSEVAKGLNHLKTNVQMYPKNYFEFAKENFRLEQMAKSTSKFYRETLSR